MSKRILIVSGFFYPEITPRAFRTTELAKEFARQGHQVTLLIPNMNEVQQLYAAEHNFVVKSLGTKKWTPVSVKGTGLRQLVRRGLLRGLKLLVEYPEMELYSMVKKALSNSPVYDLLISVAVPHPIHWGVAAAMNSKNKIATRWIADCGDPYMGQENDSFKPLFYFKFFEKSFCKKATLISVPTTGAIQAYYPEFHHKIRVIPQGFNFEEFATEDNGSVINLVPQFAYAGVFIPGRRDPREMLDYLCSLTEDFCFHIYTSTPLLVEPYLEKGKGRIKVYPFVSRPELLQRLSKMDFVVNFENVGARQTPSKLIDYAIIRKPVLSVKTNELDTNVIIEFLNGNYSSQLVIDNPDQYRIENVCRQFLD